jgi:cephalosporin-C deacetylase-like acetyl esterase
LFATTSGAGLLDNAWLKGTTDKDPLTYAPGEEIVFTVTPMNLDGDVPEGEYTLEWTFTDDFGRHESDRIPFTGEPFVYRTSLDKPGFVRLQAFVCDAQGNRYAKKYTGDTTTPEGQKAMTEFDKKPQRVFFDGGAGVSPEKLEDVAEPADFDAFWAKQFARLDLVPIKADRVETDSPNDKVRRWAVRIDCAGLRPVTGYLSIPKAADEGATFPARLETHGYSGDSFTPNKPGWTSEKQIILNINAHGMKLPEFGATEADRKALRWEVRSHDKSYAFDPEQNKDPETAYFNGMVLRVKRGLQYLKTVEGWNGTDLVASGGSQGGLQTIWAAGCGEGVTRAESGITWCCDMKFTWEHRKGWYIQWTDAMGYYDAVNFGKRIPESCHTIITRAGIGDYTCPPTGLAKLYNAVPGTNKAIKWVQGSQHGYVPPEYEGRDTTWGN